VSEILLRAYNQREILTATGLNSSSKPLSDERLDSLVQDLEEELTKTGAYFPMRFIWAMKPF
jgi:hypothetical protein